MTTTLFCDWLSCMAHNREETKQLQFVWRNHKISDMFELSQNLSKMFHSITSHIDSSSLINCLSTIFFYLLEVWKVKRGNKLALITSFIPYMTAIQYVIESIWYSDWYPSYFFLHYTALLHLHHMKIGKGTKKILFYPELFKGKF